MPADTVFLGERIGLVEMLISSLLLVLIGGAAFGLLD